MPALFPVRGLEHPVSDVNQPVSRRWAKALLWLTVLASVATIAGFLLDVGDLRKNRDSPSRGAGGSTPTTAPLTANGDEQFLQPGQCAKNTGTGDKLVLEIAKCEAGAMEIMARIEQAVSTDDEADVLCGKKAPGFVDYHYSNWERKSQFVDVVFCLRPVR